MAFVRMCDRCKKIVAEKNIVRLGKVTAILEGAPFEELEDGEDRDICKKCFSTYADWFKPWWGYETE